ncbi:MAG TPA: glycosyltransferase family 4 protein [Candidatus Limnocylindria bacterium]
MRIAQVAPLYESVPPQTYGGTERVVSYLTEELVRQGHEVTLFASGDSVTEAKLVPCAPNALRLDDDVIDPYARQIVELEAVAARASEFDVIHWHLDYFHFPLSRRLATPSVTTLHGRLDIPELQPLYDEFGDMPVVSISNDQRSPLPQANWVATVHHGMPSDELPPRLEPGEYLAFLGRISPEKRADRAIEVARRAGMPLRIAAKVDDVDRAYFEEHIEPMLEAEHVEFIGEIGSDAKGDFLGRAAALLFPIDWSEPFGLVMIEAMACGTPVIAYRSGSVPEVITDGVNGFVVDDIDGSVAAVERLGSLSRAGCRQAFEARFTVERMARDYVALYEHLAALADGTVALTIGDEMAPIAESAPARNV